MKTMRSRARLVAVMLTASSWAGAAPQDPPSAGSSAAANATTAPKKKKPAPISPDQFAKQELRAMCNVCSATTMQNQCNGSGGGGGGGHPLCTYPPCGGPTTPARMALATKATVHEPLSTQRLTCYGCKQLNQACQDLKNH